MISKVLEIYGKLSLKDYVQTIKPGKVLPWQSREDFLAIQRENLREKLGEEAAEQIKSRYRMPAP